MFLLKFTCNNSLHSSILTLDFSFGNTYHFRIFFLREGSVRSNRFIWVRVRSAIFLRGFSTSLGLLVVLMFPWSCLNHNFNYNQRDQNWVQNRIGGATKHFSTAPWGLVVKQCNVAILGRGKDFGWKTYCGKTLDESLSDSPAFLI